LVIDLSTDDGRDKSAQWEGSHEYPWCDVLNGSSEWWIVVNWNQDLNGVRDVGKDTASLSSSVE
jgi:hypothetical protein